jgi:hypothetical protein
MALVSVCDFSLSVWWLTRPFVEIRSDSATCMSDQRFSCWSTLALMTAAFSRRGCQRPRSLFQNSR